MSRIITLYIIPTIFKTTSGYHGIATNGLTLIIPGLFALYVGCKKSQIKHMTFYFIPAFLFFVLSYTMLMEVYKENAEQIKAIASPWPIYAGYLAFFAGISLAPNNRWVGKQSVRTLFSSLFLIALIGISLIRYHQYYHHYAYTIVSLILPGLYFLANGCKESKLQIPSLIGAGLSLGLSSIIMLHYDEPHWAICLAYVAPIIIWGLIPDNRWTGKQSVRTLFSFIFLIALIAISLIGYHQYYHHYAYTIVSLILPGLYFLANGCKESKLQIPYLMGAGLSLGISSIIMLRYNEPDWAIYLAYVVPMIIWGLIPNNQWIEKRIHRAHFVTLFLLGLSIIALCQRKNEFCYLTELIPIMSALAFMILESVWWKRQNHRWMMWITAGMLYLISTTIVIDIATQFKPLFDIKLDGAFIPSVLTVMTIMPILIEHLLCSKQQDRPYNKLMLVAYCIPAVLTILIICVEEEVFPIATSIIAIVTGLIGTWCISHREKKHTDAVMAISVFAGFVLLFKTIYDLVYDNAGDEIFKLPRYFIWIFSALITALIAFYDGHKIKGYTNLRAVWGISAIPLLFVTRDVYHIAHVAGILAISGNLLQYLRDKGHSDHDRTLITISAGIFATAVSIKIYMLLPSFPIPMMIRPELIMLIPVLCAYLLSKFTWHFRKPSHEISFMLAALALFLLLVCPDEDILFHTIVITAISLLSIGFSIFKKFKRYLLLGCALIVIIFFRQTSSFWINLCWWIYLAIVAVLLVTIAVVNEIMSRKGSSILKEMQKSKLNQWKW